jgi:hypothetical protein
MIFCLAATMWPDCSAFRSYPAVLSPFPSILALKSRFRRLANRLERSKFYVIENKIVDIGSD